MTKVTSTYLEKNPEFISVRKDRILFDNGEAIDGYIVNESSDWVNAVVITDSNELVLVKQYRHAIGKETIEIPAGSIEIEESPEEAIVREIKEETGYESAIKPSFLGKHYVNPASFTNSISSYLITNAQKKFMQNLDKNEQIEIILVPWNQVDTMIESGEIKQLFSINAILLAQKKINQIKGEDEID